jgi:hypothetical protein
MNFKIFRLHKKNIFFNFKNMLKPVFTGFSIIVLTNSNF